MTEINERNKKLIVEGKKEEAIKSIMEDYGLDETKAEEFYNRYRKANEKIIKPGLAKKLSRGCGCSTVFFFIFFVFALYTGFKSLSNEDVQIEATITGYVAEEEVDQFDAKIESYYKPIVKFNYDGKEYTDTLYSRFSSKEFTEGETISIFINPYVPEHATLTKYGIWDVIGDAAVYLFLALVSFVGFRFLKGLKFGFNMPELKVPKTETDSEEGRTKGSDLNSDETVDSEAETKRIPSTELKSEKKFVTRPDSKKNSNPLILSIIGIVLMLVGIAIGFTNFYNIQHGKILANGERIAGIVVNERISRSGSSNKTTTYYYTIEYQFNDQSYIYKTHLRFDQYDNGDRIEMMLNPNDPADAAINIDEDLYGGGSYFWALILILFGGWLTKWGYGLWNKEGRPSLRKKIN